MTQTNLGPCQGDVPQSIRVNDHDLAVCCRRLAVTTNIAFDLVVDAFSQDVITQSIIDQNHYFPPGYSLLTEVTQPGDRVLDLGAHIGTFTLYAAAQGYQVVAVDANPTNLALLRTSCELNQFQRVHLIQAAVSDRAGVLDFVPAGPYGVVANPAVVAPTIQVRADTVPALLDEIGWTHADFIKLDIEGSEVYAVRGMAALLAQPDSPPILFESNGYTLGMFGETPNTLLGALEEFGYRCYLVEPGRLTPVRASEIQPACNVDYLAMKGPLKRFSRWRLSRPLTLHACCQRITAEISQPPEVRAYIGRMLSGAGAPLLGEPAIHAALARLQQDEDDRVRAAVNWWDPAQYPPSNAPLRIVRRLGDAFRSRLPW